MGKNKVAAEADGGSSGSDSSSDEFFESKVERLKKKKENTSKGDIYTNDSNTPDVVKLRRRRRMIRKKYWDRVLQIAYENEKTKPYEEANATGEKLTKDWKKIYSSSNMHDWLDRTTAALPSKMGEGPVPGKLLQGTHYRLFKRAGNLIYAKCAFTDDNDAEDNPDDNAAHLKEAGGPDQSEFRKDFSYSQHLDNIRSFPTTLKKKKKMYKYLNAEAELFKQMNQTNHRVNMKTYVMSCRSVFGGVIGDISPVFDFWKSSIRTLYEHFGNEVYLCFLWTRKLFYILIGYMIFGLLVVVLPEMVEHLCKSATRPCLATNSCDFEVTNLITGSGWFDSNCMYYGGYTSDPIQTFTFVFNVSYRLIILWFSVVTINAIVILLRVKKLKRFTQESDKETLFYFHEIFCCWEFSMNSIHLARIVQEAIAKKLAFLNSHVQNQGTHGYYDESRNKRWSWLTKKFVSGTHGVQVYHWMINIIVLIIAGVSSTVFWYLLHFSLEPENDILGFLLGLYFTIMFEFVSPWVITLTDMGLWLNKITRNYWSLLRLCCIYGSIYFIFFLSFLLRSNQKIISKTGCYETELGHTLYRIILWEFIFSSVYWALKDLLLNYVIWKGRQNHVQPEPTMDGYFISSVFMQALVGMGLQFAPIIPVLCLLVCYAKFLLKRTILMCAFRPPRIHALKRDYDMPYFISYYIFFVLTTFCGIHFFATGKPSRNCGALIHAVVKSNKTNPTYRDAIMTIINADEVSHYVWEFILTPPVGFLLVVIIFGAVYIVKHWGDSYQITLDVYNGLLHLERQDRKFLLRAIYDMSTRGNTGGTDFSLVLDKNNIYKAKIRFLSTLIVGGKRHNLSQQYQEKMARRQEVADQILSQYDRINDKQRRKVERVIRDEIRSRKDLAPTPESIEARRASLAQKFLLHTEAIRLAHTASRKGKQRKWAESQVGHKS